jgi:hypothetical protein
MPLQGEYNILTTAGSSFGKFLPEETKMKIRNSLKGDRETIREYLKGNKSGYYRGKWRFSYLPFLQLCEKGILELKNNYQI